MGVQSTGPGSTTVFPQVCPLPGPLVLLVVRVRIWADPQSASKTAPGHSGGADRRAGVSTRAPQTRCDSYDQSKIDQAAPQELPTSAPELCQVVTRARSRYHA